MKYKVDGYDEYEYVFAGKSSAFRTSSLVSRKSAEFHTPDLGFVVMGTETSRMSLQCKAAYFTGRGFNIDSHRRWIGMNTNSL